MDQQISMINSGYFSDKYFVRTKDILEKDNNHVVVTMQIFQKNDNVCVCGIDEVIDIFKNTIQHELRKKLIIKTLKDGNIVNQYETIMTIQGPYHYFAHLETIYLGILTRRTKVATNVYRSSLAANKKPILFFPARFDDYHNQSGDGYAYNIGIKAAKGINGGVSTDAQGELICQDGIGTMPHGLIAAYRGDTVKAALKFCEYIDPKIKRVVLVDFDNDCVETTINVASAMFTRYNKGNFDPKYKLFAVRLDTSNNMIDKSITYDQMGKFDPRGVNPQLILNLQNKLNEIIIGNLSYHFSINKLFAQYLSDIKIIVSGGFTPEKISYFENQKLPIYAYGVGSSLYNGNFDFTADIVQVESEMEEGHMLPCAKVGRKYSHNNKLYRI